MRKWQLCPLTDRGRIFTFFSEGATGRTGWILILPFGVLILSRCHAAVVTDCVYILVSPGWAQGQPRKPGSERRNVQRLGPRLPLAQKPARPAPARPRPRARSAISARSGARLAWPAPAPCEPLDLESAGVLMANGAAASPTPSSPAASLDDGRGAGSANAANRLSRFRHAVAVSRRAKERGFFAHRLATDFDAYRCLPSRVSADFCKAAPHDRRGRSVMNPDQCSGEGRAQLELIVLGFGRR